MSDLDQVSVFAEFLVNARGCKGRDALAPLFTKENVSIRYSTLAKWESVEFPVFPCEDKLPAIAKVYEVDLEQLRAVWCLAKSARREQVDSRRSMKSSAKVSSSHKFSGRISAYAHIARNRR